MRSRFKGHILIVILVLFLSPNVQAQSQEGRLESEYKLSLPEDEVETVWNFLKTEFLQNGDSTIQTDTSLEIFYDQYFDDPSGTMLLNKAGLRYRERYVQDSLIKALVQVKLPTADKSGLAREEHKFDLYQKADRSDRKAMHPFLRYIKPKDRDELDLLLARFQTAGKNMSPDVKVKQIRKRIYVSQDGDPYMTFTLDKVSSFYFPYSSFTELELELNEILYTQVDYAEKKKMESYNAAVKEKIANAFPNIQQDQTPKYNKMSSLLQTKPAAMIYDNLMYVLLIAICLWALILYFMDKKQRLA